MKTPQLKMNTTSSKLLSRTRILSLLKRRLNLFEYQCKTLLAENGCTVQRFCVLERGKYDNVQNVAAPAYVVKAQILPGDRGRGIFTSGFRGGVHLTKSRREAVEIAQRMLGQTLVTNQTGDRGAPVDRVIVAESVPTAKRKYICFALDPIHGPSIHVAAESNNSFDAKDGLSKCAKGTMAAYRVRLTDALPAPIVNALLATLNFGRQFDDKVATEVAGLWRVFRKYHVLYLAVNPLALSAGGDIVCLDAKMTIDNAALQLPHIARRLADLQDGRSRQDNLNDAISYIQLGGNIGCVVDGAGLAMATNDLLHRCGGRPANFSHLNLARDAADDGIRAAMQALGCDARITSILVNVNWHRDCTRIARSLIDARPKPPLVLRLRGANEEAAWRTLEHSALKVYRANDTEEAVRKVVALSDVRVQLLHDKSA